MGDRPGSKRSSSCSGERDGNLDRRSHNRYRNEFDRHPSGEPWLRQRQRRCVREHIRQCGRSGQYAPWHKGRSRSTVTGSFGQTGDASVIYRSGTINLVGASFSAGIFATAPGSATITTLSGTSITVSQGFSADIAQEGIEAFATNGATLVTAASTILVNGNQTSPVADFRSQPKAIQVQSNSGGPAEVDYTGPGITVHGGGGLGIAAVSRSGSVTVNAFGGIVADGTDAVGILADSGTLRNAISGGLPPASITGPVQVTASNVSAPGQFGTAISANGGSGGVTVNIPSGGSIMGGWQASPFVTPATPLFPGRPPASVTPAGNI